MTTLGTWDGWNEMKAEERVFEDDAAGEKIRELKAGLVGLREVTTWNAFVIRERFFGDISWCERCDEQFPDILMFTFDEDDPCVESALCVLLPTKNRPVRTVESKNLTWPGEITKINHALAGSATNKLFSRNILSSLSNNAKLKLRR
jgi:hypothetical protein